MPWLVRAWPAVADLAVLAFFLLAQPVLVQRLRQPQAGNMVLVLAAFLAGCCGIYLIRCAQAAASTTPAPVWMGALLACSGIFTTVAAVQSAGWFERTSPLFALDMNRGRDSAVMIAGAIVWLVLAFLPLIALYAPPPHRPAASSQRGMLYGIGALLVNCLVAVTAAWWAALGLGEERLAWRVKLVAFLPVYAALALFYAPPRLLLIWALGDVASRWTFALCLGVYTWCIL